MSKYTKEELKIMAQIALAAKDRGNPRYIALMYMLITTQGLSLEECLEKIKELADGVI